MQEAQPKPHVLDDYTVNRGLKGYTAQQNDLELFDEQLHRWAAGPRTAAQHAEVDRLQGQMRWLRKLIAAILRLAGELSARTREKQWAQSDIELWIAVLRQDRPTEG